MLAYIALCRLRLSADQSVPRGAAAAAAAAASAFTPPIHADTMEEEDDNGSNRRKKRTLTFRLWCAHRYVDLLRIIWCSGGYIVFI
jgi:hypothetical protein